MSDVRKLIPELDLIPVERTSLMPAKEPKRVDHGREIRRYDG